MDIYSKMVKSSRPNALLLPLCENKCIIVMSPPQSITLRPCSKILDIAGENMRAKDEWILVFDSGLGGLSVLRELTRVLPNERFLYFGDSRNAPYGTRPTDEVRQLTLDGVTTWMPRSIKAVIIACNTATAAAIEALRDIYPHKIVIGMEPALKLAADRHTGGRIVVMATNVTLREAKFCALMDRFSAICRVAPLPCPGLVEFVESGQLDTPELRQYLTGLLAPTLAHGADAIVLGCTHFPFLKPVIQDIAGPNVEILDGGLGTALQTQRRLEEAGLLRDCEPGQVELHNSLETPELLARSARLLALN